jgi:hypothetical protein
MKNTRAGAGGSGAIWIGIVIGLILVGVVFAMT